MAENRPCPDPEDDPASGLDAAEAPAGDPPPAAAAADSAPGDAYQGRARLAEERLAEVIEAYRTLKTDNEAFRDRTARNLERRFDKPWHEVVRETVLEPLGMTATTARLSSVPGYHLAMPHDFSAGQLGRIALLKSDRTMHAAGGHVTTAGDIARFLVAQLNGGRVAGRRVFPAAAIEETHRQMVSQDRAFSFVYPHLALPAG